MILFHGSNGKIGEIQLSQCLPYQDFGPGFYTTAEEEQAWLMAVRCVAREGCDVPTITTFDVPDDLLLQPNLFCKAFPEQPDMEWTHFVWNNRNRGFRNIADENCNQDCKYDIVSGPTPNDRFDFCLSSLRGSDRQIQEGSLEFSLPRHFLPQQYSFHTERALHYLKAREERSYSVLQRSTIKHTAADLAYYLMEDDGLSVGEALDRVYLSQTFSRLEDPYTGLYREGSACIYERLKQELAG